MADAIEPGVVNIDTRVGNGIGAGTGMILTADGQILTNNHVIDGARQINVTAVADGRQYRATVMGADPDEDVAVIKLVGASGLTPIPLGNSDDVQVGDPVAAIGNAGGRGGDPEVAPGSVVALDQQITATDERGGNAETLTGVIQVDADMQQGESGGPLADGNGRTVGINTAAAASRNQYRTTERQGFAIPINHALDIARRLIADAPATGGEPGRAHLGVRAETDPAGGARITEVTPDSPAAAAGLTAGATVTAVGDARMRTAADLTAAVQAHAPGDEVTLLVRGRDGRTRRVLVTFD